MAQTMPLQQDDPRRIGDYEVIGRLGAGGMGVVFLARSATGRPVAIKVVHAELARDPEFRSRFSGEVTRARQVPPFCTAEVIDADPEADRPYLVVEYVEGPTLAEEVTARGPMSAANLHGLAIGIATALTAIHEAGVIHRDLKPGNVLLAPGSPKVIDFGIARALEAPHQETRNGQFVGTIGYMAPERFEGSALTPAADVFSWGCVVTYAGTGRAPFDANTPVATLARILTQPPALDGLAEGPLRRLVERALSADPAQRPSARELHAALLSGSSSVPRAAEVPPSSLAGMPSLQAGDEAPTQAADVPARQPAARPDRRRPVVTVLGAVLALALAGGIGFLAYRGTAEARADTDPVSGLQSVDPGYSTPQNAPPLSSIPASAIPTPSASTPAARPPSSAAKPSSAPPKPTPPAGRKNQPAIKAADRNGAAAYGPYFVQNLHTGRCIDVPGTGAGAVNQQVKQDVCLTAADDNQEYLFIPHGADAAGNQLYWIRNTADDLCLDVPGAGAVPTATRVTEMNCIEQDNQDYTLVPRLTSGGWEYYHLRNAASGMCIDVYGNRDPAPALVLTLVTCGTDNDHEWALIERSEW
ncbi:protein kinase [Catenuloplanes sp. NPDC051500]|uniref:protein kinase domain-containing protein n=1 Tax=Catenuloplanes sp. NPDC051500 TaxID=3363959 RepID=UPI0037B21577